MSDQPKPPRFPLTVTDIRQFDYCPRVVYFTYVQPLERPITYKMEHGLSAEQRIAALERRRTLHRYHLQHGERLFDHWLRSEPLGLAGRADMLILAPEAVYPVEFKYSDGGVSHNHRLQLTAYALMAENHFSRPAHYGFICRLTDGQVWRVSTTGQWREKVHLTLQRIRVMLDTERFPAPPKRRGKCVDCEYRRFCGDV